MGKMQRLYGAIDGVIAVVDKHIQEVRAELAITPEARELSAKQDALRAFDEDRHLKCPELVLLVSKDLSDTTINWMSAGTATFVQFYTKESEEAFKKYNGETKELRAPLEAEIKALAEVYLKLPQHQVITRLADIHSELYQLQERDEFGYTRYLLERGQEE
jgi:hypothetical protein